MAPEIIKIVPIISEKSKFLVNSQNTYLFKVFPYNVNRVQIKQFIEKKFKVKVAEVRTANYPKRKRGRTRIINVRPRFKKAYVKLAPNYSISIFE